MFSYILLSLLPFLVLVNAQGSVTGTVPATSAAGPGPTEPASSGVPPVSSLSSFSSPPVFTTSLDSVTTLVDMTTSLVASSTSFHNSTSFHAASSTSLPAAAASSSLLTTTSPAVTTTSAHSASSAKHKSPNTRVIVGVIIGVVAILLFGTGLFFLYRQRRQRFQASIRDLNGRDNLSTETRGPWHPVASQIGVFGPDFAVQGRAFPGMEQHNQEGMPIASVGAQPGIPFNANPQLQLVAQNLPIESSEVKPHVTHSPSTPSHIQPLPSHPFEAAPTPPQSHPTSTRDVVYSQTQLDLLRKLSESGAEGSVITAVAKSLLGGGNGAVSGEVEARDMDLLQRLSDSGADGSVIRGVAESIFQRGSSSAGERSPDVGGPGKRPRPLPRTEKDAPPIYDFTG